MSYFWYIFDTKNKLLGCLGRGKWSRWEELAQNKEEVFLDQEYLADFINEIVASHPESITAYRSKAEQLFNFAQNAGIDNLQFFTDDTDDLVTCHYLQYKCVFDWSFFGLEFQNRHIDNPRYDLRAERNRKYLEAIYEDSPTLKKY